MNHFVFENPEIQSQWEAFCDPAWDRLRKLSAKVPKDLNTRVKGLENIIETLMAEQFGNDEAGLIGLAELNGRIEYFRDVANAEVMMSLYEANPKQNITMLKAQAEGKIASITALAAFAKHIWAAVERALMSAQSLLKRAP